MKRFTILYISTIVLTLIIFMGCSPDVQTINNPDLVFSSSYRLDVPSYTYKDSSGIYYFVSGDTTEFVTNIVDTLNSNPLFRWDTFNTNITCCAIFLKPIDVEGGIITNPEDMIWQWHSGMKNGQNGYVQFSDGKNVINGTIEYENVPDSLQENNYYWAVWAWNKSATSILYSSRQMQFYVSK